MYSDSLISAATKLVQTCHQKSLVLSTAESCTGGLLAGLITSVSGASDVFEMGFITYSNDAKHQMIAVDEELLETHGAVSDEIARAMAEGALARANADIALSITGIAGPSGGSIDKPVGLVYIACATAKVTECNKYNFSGDRQRIRLQSCEKAIHMAASALT